MNKIQTALNINSEGEATIPNCDNCRHSYDYTGIPCGDVRNDCDWEEQAPIIKITEEQAKEMWQSIDDDYSEEMVLNTWKDKGYIAHVKTALEKAREYYSEVEKTVGNNELYSIYNIMCLKDLYEQAIKELQEGYNG